MHPITSCSVTFEVAGGQRGWQALLLGLGDELFCRTFCGKWLALCERPQNAQLRAARNGVAAQDGSRRLRLARGERDSIVCSAQGVWCLPDLLDAKRAFARAAEGFTGASAAMRACAQACARLMRGQGARKGRELHAYYASEEGRKRVRQLDAAERRADRDGRVTHRLCIE